MEIVLQAILSLLGALAPSLTTSATVQTVIEALIKILPVVISTFRAFVPHVKEIISILTSNPATLPDQVAQLEAMSAQCDADFDAAAKAAADEDAAGA